MALQTALSARWTEKARGSLYLFHNATLSHRSQKVYRIFHFCPLLPLVHSVYQPQSSSPARPGACHRCQTGSLPRRSPQRSLTSKSLSGSCACAHRPLEGGVATKRQSGVAAGTSRQQRRYRVHLLSWRALDLPGGPWRACTAAEHQSARGWTATCWWWEQGRWPLV